MKAGMYFLQTLLLGFVLSVCAQADSIQSKIAYLNVIYPDPNTSVFVGQHYSVSYELTLFSGANLTDVSFVDLSADNNVELLNKNARWQKTSSDVLTNTYIYKIKAKNFVIPPLRVVAVSSDGEQIEEVLANGLRLQAIDLSNNPNYANVIADSLEVVDYRVREYDAEHNIVIFQLAGIGVNFKSMKIGQFALQGLESNKVSDGIAYGIYYVVLDKGIKNLSFDYFNLLQKRFVGLNVPIQLAQKSLDRAGSIKPRNTFLVFNNLIVGVALFVCILLLAVRKVRKFILGIIVLLLLYLAYNLFFSASSGIAQTGAQISIVPTHNSTITEVIKTPTKVDIIGEYHDYYKVMMDTRVGWIRREYVSKD